MMPGFSAYITGSRCRFTRTVERNSIRNMFADLCGRLADQIEAKRKEDPKAAEQMSKSRPKLSHYVRSLGGRSSSHFERIQEKGVIVRENARTVWIQFAGDQTMKVKKARVELA